MKTLPLRVVALGVAAFALGFGSVAMAVEAPDVSDSAWRTLEQLFQDAQTAASERTLEQMYQDAQAAVDVVREPVMHAAASKKKVVMQTSKKKSVDIRKQPLSKRNRDADMWARAVIRGKEKDAERVAAIIAQEQKVEIVIVQAEKIPSRERLVRAHEAGLPDQCSKLHTHERSRCLYQLSLVEREVPAIVAAARSTHGAAR